MGWRIDYFVLTQAFMPYCVDSTIHNEYQGSDHCPIQLKLDLTGKSCSPGELIYAEKEDEKTAAQTEDTQS